MLKLIERFRRFIAEVTRESTSPHTDTHDPNRNFFKTKRSRIR